MTSPFCTRCGKEVDPIQEIIDSTVSQNGRSHYEPKPMLWDSYHHKCAIAKAIEDERRWQAFLMRSMISDAELAWGCVLPEAREILAACESQVPEPVKGGEKK